MSRELGDPYASVIEKAGSSHKVSDVHCICGLFLCSFILNANIPEAG